MNNTAQGGRNLMIARLAIGLVQGLALWLLTGQDDALQDPRLAAGLLIAGLTPIALLGGLGVMRGKVLAPWIGAVALVAGGLGAYQATWSVDDGVLVMTAAGLAVGCFIAHVLILAGDQERKRVASYERYFDLAWTEAVRLALAVAFVGALWAILGLGAGLFKLIGIDAVAELIASPWFAFPASCVVFALAIHLTELRATLVKGARTLALTLLAWLLPLMTLVVAGFLATLPFTGLAPLWGTGSAARILLAAAGGLIILINAAYQAGERDDFPPKALKWAALAASAALLPLVAIAGYGVLARIGQYSLTPERVLSGACVIVGGAYALGYLFAAVSRGGWMRRLEGTNVAVAWLVLALLLALLSPLADPRRLSVDDQVGRLTAGKITPQAFDYQFLRFQSGRYGERALARLASGTAGKAAAQLAKSEQARKGRYAAPEPTQQQKADMIAAAGGGALPDGFLTQSWVEGERPFAGCREPGDCAALVRDLDGDGVPEVAILGGLGRPVYRREGERWARVGSLVGDPCGEEIAAAREGRVALEVPKPWADVVMGRARLRFMPDAHCAPAPNAALREDPDRVRP